MKTSVKIVVGVIVAIALLIIGSAIIQHIAANKYVNEVMKPDEAKAEFMSTCYAGDESMYDYCSCTYDDLESKYGVGGIAKMGLEYEKTGIISDEMLESAMSCFDRL